MSKNQCYVKAFATGFAVILLSDIACVNFLNRLVINRMKRYPALVLGSGISMAIQTEYSGYF